MAEEAIIEEEDMPPPRRRWRKGVGIGLGAFFGLLLLLLIAGTIWLDTRSGHEFVRGQIEALEFETGMEIRIGSIDGSIYDEMVLTDVAVRDPRGAFLTIPRVEMDWHPFAFIGRHVDIDALIVPRARLLRLPEFNETPPSDDPLLPDLDIDVDRLEIGQLVIEPAVTGRRHAVRLAGEAHIADGRAVVDARGRALKGRNIAGGDSFNLALDAVPEENELNVAMNLRAPGTGLIAALTGIAEPMQLSLNGQGDWQRWQGSLKGRTGQNMLADVAIAARDGMFKIAGDMRPGLLLSGPARELLEPVTKVNLTATMDERRVTLGGGLGSDYFVFTAKGLVDLGENRMRDLALDFRLLKPGALAENLKGSGIVANLLLNGDFASPEIDYRINAAAIGFDQTVAQGLRMNGNVRLREDRWLIPISARAKAITGLNAAAGELLTNVSINGDLAYDRGRVLSDNLRIRSDRIDATAIVLADLNEGVYTGGLQGRVNDYRVDGVGSFNLVSDIDLEADANGSYRLAGTIRARSQRIFNDGAREFLGGNALIVADVSYSTAGVARLTRLNVAAPAFRLTGGSGSYAIDSGRLRFSARGSSNQYGPLAVDASGTLANPRVEIAAARPGLGVGLANVVATVNGTPSGYAIVGRGDSDYGPFDADVELLMGRGAMAVQVNQGTSFAGVGLTGRISQTPAGPFAGDLAASGSGINGTVALSSYQGVQRAMIDARALDAQLPGPQAVSIGRGIIDADIILTEQPQAVADIQLESARSGEFFLGAMRARVDYRDGQGSAQILAEGRNRFPFRIAANARMRPDLWRIALQGRANGIDFATKNPAEIIPENGRYTLRPTTVDLSRGSVQLAGSYGNGMTIQSRLNDVDLALVNPIMPGLGLGGRATGSLDFAQENPNAFPRADARLRIDDFTRTSLASVSKPVDIHLVGRLLADGGNARAIVRRRGAAIGRMQVDLRPLPPGAGPWMTRLMAAPLSGGIRYNGPADTLFSLAALPDQSLSGAIGVAADFTGRVQQPQLSGVVRANNLIYENGAYGTRLTNMRVRGNFTGTRLEVEELTARAGDGTISGSGFVSLSSSEGFPIQLALDMNNARLASGSALAAVATGQLRIVNGPNQPPTISGRIALPETRYKIVREGSTKVATLTGVRRKPAQGRQKITGDAEPISTLPTDWQLDIDIVADNGIFVTGMGLNSEWAADIQLRGTSGNPQVTGGIRLVRGTLGFAGRSFDLTEGRLRFNGGAISNPTLRLIASGEADDVTVNVVVAGTGQNPDISFTSTPSLPQDEIVSRILFGNSIGELSAVQAVQLAASLNSLRGGSGGLNPLGVLQSSAGIDRLRILGGDEESGRGTSVAVGQYITNDVYVEVVTDARGYTATQLEISLTKALSLLSQFGTFGGSNVNLQYRKDY